jgi:oligopeptide transport system ATP-binding protein
MNLAAPLLRVDNLSTVFHVGSRGVWPFRVHQHIKAVTDVSFSLTSGQTIGVVGESGCGKSTLGRSILRLIEPTSGRVSLAGEDLTGLADKVLRLRRRDLQIIFQDPVASLNPRMTVGQIIAEPLKVYEPDLSAAERRSRVLEIMHRVGLMPIMINRYPHEFSGGQAQRIGIARAIIQNPKIVVCDEPVSALDVSIQAQIINLLIALKKSLGLALIFISHDLSIVRHISDQIMVLYLGRVVEIGPAEEVFGRPRHPYTRALLDAVLVPDPVLARTRALSPLKGEVPSPINPPSGCAFRTRCRFAVARCASDQPELRLFKGRSVACHLAEEISGGE